MYGDDYGSSLGHLLDNMTNFNPDEIEKRTTLYLYYIDKLIDLLSIKENKNDFQKDKIKNAIKVILNNAAKGSYSNRLDGILAFECEYYKKTNAAEIIVDIPVKFNPPGMKPNEIIVDAINNDFRNDAEKIRDILLTYLTNRLIIDKILWIPINNNPIELDQITYQNNISSFFPEVITSGSYNVNIKSYSTYIKITLTKK